MEARFYDHIDGACMKYAAILSCCHGKRVLRKHRGRDSYAHPVGRMEAYETIKQAAKRQLMEKAGARDFPLWPMCDGPVAGKNRTDPAGEESRALLHAAQIPAFEERFLCKPEGTALPQQWTYPRIQPLRIA